jgi:hypothetical protein
MYRRYLHSSHFPDQVQTKIVPAVAVPANAARRTMRRIELGGQALATSSIAYRSLRPQGYDLRVSYQRRGKHLGSELDVAQGKRVWSLLA